MLVSYSGNDYKDAEKVNQHIKEVAITQLPVTNNFDVLLPELSPQQKLYILQALGFKPQMQDNRVLPGYFSHELLENESPIVFDVDKESLTELVREIHKAGWAKAFKKYNVIS